MTGLRESEVNFDFRRILLRRELGEGRIWCMEAQVAGSTVVCSGSFAAFFAWDILDLIRNKMLILRELRHLLVFRLSGGGGFLSATPSVIMQRAAKFHDRVHHPRAPVAEFVAQDAQPRAIASKSPAGKRGMSDHSYDVFFLVIVSRLRLALFDELFAVVAGVFSCGATISSVGLDCNQWRQCAFLG